MDTQGYIVMEEVPIEISPQYIKVMTAHLSQMKMILDNINQYLVAPLWHFPCQNIVF